MSFRLEAFFVYLLMDYYRINEVFIQQDFILFNYIRILVRHK